MRATGQTAVLLLVGTLCIPVCGQQAASSETTIARAEDGVVVWSPDATQYILNKKDTSGTYQLYVGTPPDQEPVCISCAPQPNSPAPKHHKLQASWHSSCKWNVLAVEREDYSPPFLATPDLIEGWIQSGLWVNIYMTRPDGGAWRPDGRSISALNLFFPTYETWTITFSGPECGDSRPQSTNSPIPITRSFSVQKTPRLNSY